MDTDLEGLAREDRQKRRGGGGEKDQMPYTKSEYKSGARVCKNKQSATRNVVSTTEPLPKSSCKNRRVDLACSETQFQSHMTRQDKCV